MFAGRHYSFIGLLAWTRRDIYLLFFISSIPTILYEVFEWKHIVLPWVPIALVGTAVAFLVSFKNNASYDRTWEARKIWGGIVNYSRTFTLQVLDFIRQNDTDTHETDLKMIHARIVYRHIAWLSALRYQLRTPRPWESMNQKHNKEYRKLFSVAEEEHVINEELEELLHTPDIEHIMGKKNRATHILKLQGEDIRKLRDRGLINDFKHVEMERVLEEFYNLQGMCERIKNFPYPRQYATMNRYFVMIFVLLLPFGMLEQFAELSDVYSLTWLNIPFSVLVSWIFTTMERIGDSTENPFEGGPNDIPITGLSRTIEIDLREMIGETDLPEPVPTVNDILT